MGEWTVQIGNNDQMEGIYAQAQLRLIDKSTGRIRFVDNFTVASGLLVDRR
jgi:hypothetical protein